MKELLLFLAAALASLPLLVSRPLGSLSAPTVAAVPPVAIRVEPTPTPVLVAEEGARDARSNQATPRPQAPVPTPAPAEASGGLIEQAIRFALTWLKVPYAWAGCSRRGIDCSCFVQTVLASIGITTAPRVTTDQVRWARPIGREDLHPLDLVFFDDTCTGCGANPTHVGLYLGGGQMIQAGGAQVSIQPVFSGFYGAHFASAGRPPGL